MKIELFGFCFMVLHWSTSAGDDKTSKANSLARGFNDNIDWKGLDEGYKLAKQLNKPGLILIHKSWCGACKTLKPKFAASQEIEELSKHMVMVNLQDDEEPKEQKYAPDGGYVPRILFFDPNGKLRKDLMNPSPSNDKYKYYYGMIDPLVQAMANMIKETSRSKAGFDEL